MDLPDSASKSPAPDRYEFTPEQNEIIGSLGNSMKWVAVPALALGMMCLLNLIMGIVWVVKTGSFKDWHVIGMLLVLLINLILFLALGRWTLTASLGFRAIAETRGRDITFLMVALDNLRKMYGLLSLFVKLFLVLTVVSLVLSLIQVYRTGEWPRYVDPDRPASTQPDR